MLNYISFTFLLLHFSSVVVVSELKGISPKNVNFVIIYSSLKLLQTCMSFFLLMNTNEDILKNVGKKTVDCIEFHSKTRQWTVNCLVTNILQNIFFCVHQKKETQTDLKQLEDE